MRRRTRIAGTAAALALAAAGCQAGDGEDPGGEDDAAVEVAPSDVADFEAALDAAGEEREEFELDELAIVVDDTTIRLVLLGSGSCPPEPQASDVELNGGVEAVAFEETGDVLTEECTADAVEYLFELTAESGWAETVELSFDRAISDDGPMRVLDGR